MTARVRLRNLAVAAPLALALTLGATAPGAGAAPLQETPATEVPTTAAPAPAPAPAGPVTLFYLPLSGPDLAKGQHSAEVFLMQIHLVLRGYHIQDFPGAFGESTRHALTAFQKYHLLPRSGVLDPLSRFILGASLERVTPSFPTLGRNIEVDINRQIMIVSTNGVTDWVFDVSTGKSSTPTPRGSYRIQREINGLRVARLGRLWRPKYFHGGYAFHGYPSVPNYNASSGCVRMYNPDIDMLWASGLAPVGTPVRIF
ncbi:MAG: L,D-transpeptidase family protein [Microthrixaceae bacterium]|nr:murein L,D-transpeptidase [Microthrixaceae bacterium]MCO5314193.1 L,D-transpeptidase family protein [Microthrixaceae bacterium]HPB45617.1 L,D-transpeptidase family protein [Microthrixaceae bacterium]